MKERINFSLIQQALERSYKELNGTGEMSEITATEFANAREDLLAAQNYEMLIGKRYSYYISHK